MVRGDGHFMGGRAINLFNGNPRIGRKNRTGLAAAPAAWALLVVLAGCGAEGALEGRGAEAVLVSVAEAASGPPSPALVLKGAYELEGQQRPVIFLDADELSEEELDEAADALAAELQVDVLPAEAAFRGDPGVPALTPVDPDTGQVGVSLTLGEIIEVEPDRYEATIFYARSGLDGGDVTLVYERQAGQWLLVGHRHGAQA